MFIPGDANALLPYRCAHTKQLNSECVAYCRFQCEAHNFSPSRIRQVETLCNALHFTRNEYSTCIRHVSTAGADANRTEHCDKCGMVAVHLVARPQFVYCEVKTAIWNYVGSREFAFKHRTLRSTEKTTKLDIYVSECDGKRPASAQR